MNHNWIKKNPSYNCCEGRVFLFPFSGGTAEYYSKWDIKTPNYVCIQPIQLPGRSYRISEPLIENIDKMIDELIKYFETICNKPYVLFGHSMGALISFQLSKKIKKIGIREPDHLFISGYHTPSKRLKHRQMSILNDREFIKELEYINGTPKEILENKDMMSIFLPILRSDLKLCESFVYQNNGQKLNYPITVFNGKKDPLIEPSTCVDWKYETSSICNVYFLDGGHFFLKENENFILEKILSPFSQGKSSVK